MTGSDDPTAIRSIAVRADDVVTALERNLRGEGDAVLRVTPPFSGRMRARIHVEGHDDYGDLAPIHVDPASLVADPPDYPEPAETEDALRSDPVESYTVERHRERHAEAVAEWRDAVADRIVDEVALPVDGEHAVAVAVLR